MTDSQGQANRDATSIEAEDVTRQRVLPVLYADWFRYDDLCPTYMWLTEFEAVPDSSDSKVGVGNHADQARRTCVLDHLGIHSRSTQDWHRFHTIHFVRPWDATGHGIHSWFVPSLGLLEPRRVVYQAGLGRYVPDSAGGIEIDLHFGPRYGRGYYLTADGNLTSTWVS